MKITKDMLVGDEHQSQLRFFRYMESHVKDLNTIRMDHLASHLYQAALQASESLDIRAGLIYFGALKLRNFVPQQREFDREIILKLVYMICLSVTDLSLVFELILPIWKLSMRLTPSVIDKIKQKRK